jgi:hypothetical protein
VSPLWQTTPQPLSTAAGLHRVLWEPVVDDTSTRGDGQQGRVPTRLTGNFTARLTVNGRSYSQPFTVKPDPRATATS